MSTISIVGLACEYPYAPTIDDYWATILRKERHFRKIPPRRLSPEYFSTSHPDKSYTNIASLIEGYKFDRIKYNVSGRSYHSTDLTHWLALDVATRALEDAGFLKGDIEIPRLKTSVIVGNTLTGEFSRANILRYRWPFVKKVLLKQLDNVEINSETKTRFLAETEKIFKAHFYHSTEDSLAGGLSNTIAGRICNYYDFKGGGYTVDGACSSSLLSVIHGCKGLISKDIDVAVVGGVDLSIDPFELVGFSRAHALAKEEMRIFDKNSNGFWPGEGCGFAILMREEQALEMGLSIYANISGWGISSDGKGGLIRPSVEGQRLALERAYEMADYGAGEVDYFEAHGTGTSLGDTIELETIKKVIAQSPTNTVPHYIGSVKGNIGHTKAAAGIAGLIKAALVVKNRVIPPITGCYEPHDLLSPATSEIKITNHPILVNNEDRKIRASVSSMGFGGINTHITLTSRKTNKLKNKLSPLEKLAVQAYQDTEMIVFGGNTIDEIYKTLNFILSEIEYIGTSELPSFAQYIHNITHGKHIYRGAVTFKNIKELQNKINVLKSSISQQHRHFINIDDGIFFSSPKQSKIAFVFPGQGAPITDVTSAIHQRFDLIENLYKLRQNSCNIDLKSTEYAQKNIIQSSLTGLLLLERFNIEGDVTIGHSLGELMSFYWANSIERDQLLEIAQKRGALMAKSSKEATAMASIFMESQHVQPILTEKVVISGFNSKKQTVISGVKNEVHSIVEQLQEKGINCMVLPVSHGFHSPYMKNGKERFLQYLLQEQSFSKPSKKIISSVTGFLIEKDTDIAHHLSQQLIEPVRFTDCIHSLQEEQVDLVIEIGPGNILSRIISQELNIPTVAMRTEETTLKHTLHALGLAYVMNKDTDMSYLFNRQLKPYKEQKAKSFFENPCDTDNDSEGLSYEMIDVVNVEVATEIAATVTEEEIVEEVTEEVVIGHLKKLISSVNEIPIKNVNETDRLLDDLHMNSVTAGKVIGEALSKFNIAPTIPVVEYSNARVLDIAKMIVKLSSNTNLLFPHTISGLDDWVEPFVIEYESTNKTAMKQIFQQEGKWELIISNKHPHRDHYHRIVSNLKKDMIYLVITRTYEEDIKELLLCAIKKASKQSLPILVIQSEISVTAFVKTYFLEGKQNTKVINVLDTMLLDYKTLEQEVNMTKGFQEVFLNEDTKLFPILKPYIFKRDKQKGIPLNSDDVLLFTGGAKGIGAECAISLARDTGVKLALIGRSNPIKDEEVQSTLERAETLGITCAYFQADVTNKQEVTVAIKKIEDQLGTITGLTHAAGINHPKPLRDIDVQDLNLTIDIKLGGLKNVLSNLNKRSLKFLIAFSSIIGRAGLEGEGHYALGNEWLSSYISSIPDIPGMSIEWSVWSGVGMGQNLGTVETLRTRGITPIPLDKGIDLFKTLLGDLLNGKVRGTIVVSGRMGNIPTLSYGSKETPLLRFVEKVHVHYPMIEMLVDVDITDINDPYINDHIFDGNRLLPAVIAIEAMAQVLNALTKKNDLPSFKDLQFRQPILLTKDVNTIRIAALRVSEDSYKLAIFSSGTNFNVIHFECIGYYHSTSIQVENQLPPFLIQSDKSTLNVKKELYERTLFQKGMFENIQSYYKVSAYELGMYLDNNKEKNWFRDMLPQELLLNDPGVRDAALHGLQASIPQKTVIPVTVKKIEHYASRQKRLKAYAYQVSQEKDIYEYNLYLYNENNELVEAWSGLKVKEVQTLGSPRNISSLVASQITRDIREFYEINDFTFLIEQIDQNQSPDQRREFLLRQLTNNEKLLKRSNGMQHTQSKNVCFSYCDNLIIGISSEKKISCDIEKIDPSIDHKNWEKILGSQAKFIAYLTSEGWNLTQAATIIWTVIECMQKDGLQSDRPLVIDKTLSNVVVFRSNSIIIYTQVVGDYVVSILTEEREV
ncbi:SDR family NAD(P)-dependent oxidoreductase [Bacillus haynesii]|uniref:SDR family NAD(P)-dependent oxidoreductase n=1 Tax=Bacillus haynesii TaxID=1925021 RepID=UPI002DBAEE28|nr:SDR family NAD(P)-dependent oxidoreductase [Bacillus haynesii]MEC1417479.1 SDR family NAD(P)-dependent oxidoreductase [Bacillus haynesii]